MSAETHCPQCGAALPAGLGASQAEGGQPLGSSTEGGPQSSAIELLAPGSNDESFLAAPYGPKMTLAEPDPILGNFVTPASGEVADPLIDLDARRSKREPRGPAESAASFPSLNFDRTSKASREAGDSDDSGTGSQEGYDRGASWTSVLLMSYASAMTLALIWVLAQRPRDREVAVEVAPPSETQPTAGRQASLSRKVAPPEPVLGRHMATMKVPLTIGSLEVTPLEIRREGVWLQRNNLSDLSKVERRDGGKNALVLRLKLRNTSKDAVFAPLDQAFLREQDKEIVDTYLETGAGERIYPFPLAVESEWSIVGQDFSELRPGEVRIVSIVSPPNPPVNESEPITWRIRLRTGIDRTDVLGFRWPSPASKPHR